MDNEKTIIRLTQEEVKALQVLINNVFPISSSPTKDLIEIERLEKKYPFAKHLLSVFMKLGDKQ